MDATRIKMKAVVHENGLNTMFQEQKFKLCMPLNEQQDILKQIELLFEEYFSNSIEEISAAIHGEDFQQEDESYNYTKSYLPTLMDNSTGKVVASAIIVEKVIKRRFIVHELVWFATSKSCASKGIGSMLFQAIHELVTCAKVYALLVESTNRALTWWLSRPGVPMANAILRADSRNSLKDPNTKLAPKDQENKKLRNIFESLIISKEDLKQMSGKRRNGGQKKKQTPLNKFIVRPFPSIQVEVLYNDSIFRNKKGQPTKSAAAFAGTPYRYNVDQASHLWFPISKAFRSSLGMHVVLHKHTLPKPLVAKEPDVELDATKFVQEDTAVFEEPEEEIEVPSRVKTPPPLSG